MKNTIRAAFPHTIPVMTGYLFLGVAFGILLESKGYGPLWSGAMSTAVFAGSMQFVAVGLLAEPFSLPRAFLMALMVNARHIFYGFSMLGKYRDMGRAKPYLVFALTDETFTLLCASDPPQGVTRRGFYLCISLLDHLYWIVGGVLGGLIGSRISMDTRGIEFAMTALFVSIFVEQCRVVQNRIPALVGIGGSLLCLAVFGPERFLLPAMAVLIAALTLLRGVIERGLGDR